jgi:putative spermidine/putrescine transport system ATP-binding protein
MSATPAVSLEGVTYRYPGTQAGVFDATLDIQPGELVVCLGPSGCGKTTLLRLIAGFLRPDAGVIRLNGAEVSALPTRERECGVVFQAYALFPHMRVWENVAYPLRVREVPLADRRRRADEMLELVGLTGLAERLPAQLSGGQQQRVALARALVFGPRALLLDEPLSALDAATRVTMRDEIRRIQREQGIATLLITHDQDEALSLADRIVLQREGRIVQTGTPLEIYDAPADAFVAGFVGRANLLEARVIDAETVETPIGRLATPPHGHPAGSALRLLVRPERSVARLGENAAAQVSATASSAPRASAPRWPGGAVSKSKPRCAIM